MEGRRLRGVKAKDAIKVFVKFGGIERKGKGDHINVKMPNGQIITIPGGRKEVKIVLLKAAIKKAGITEEKFVELL